MNFFSRETARRKTPIDGRESMLPGWRGQVGVFIYIKLKTLRKQGLHRVAQLVERTQQADTILWRVKVGGSSPPMMAKILAENRKAQVKLKTIRL